MEGVVLGVSTGATRLRMVLVEGESADGVIVDQDNFDVSGEASHSTLPNRVISAILGTREGAVEGGYRLLSSGVACTDHMEAAQLRDALIDHKIENVMLVSAFMAAAALAQAVGDATNYTRTALLFVEPYSATLAIVNTADGSVSEAHRRLLSDDEDQAVTELVQMVSGIESLETVPDGIFVVGSGVDVPMIKPALEAATSLQLSVPHEPEMALAQGAALASAHAPLFASSTVALAYAQDPGTGQVDPLAFAGQCAGYLPEHRSAAELSPDAPTGRLNVAYSAVADEDADAQTTIGLDERAQRRKSVLLVGSTLAVIFISAVVALEIALAISIRPTVALRPSPNANIVAPARPAPVAPPRAAVPAPRVSAPRPLAVPHPLAPPVGPAPLPIVPPPVFVPLPRGPVGPPRLPGVPRGPGPRGPFGGGPFGGGHVPFGGGPFGGGHGPFGGGPRLPFGGGGHGPFGGGGHMPFGGGHGFGGFGGGHGFGGHGFGGFGHR